MLYRDDAVVTFDKRSLGGLDVFFGRQTSFSRLRERGTKRLGGSSSSSDGAGSTRSAAQLVRRIPFGEESNPERHVVWRCSSERQRKLVCFPSRNEHHADASEPPEFDLVEHGTWGVMGTVAVESSDSIAHRFGRRGASRATASILGFSY